MTEPRHRYEPPGGLRLGHAFLVLALGVLTFTARLPHLRREAHEARLEDAREDVADVRGAAERFRARVGRWPEGGAPGATPEELVFEVPRRFDPVGDGYVVQWTRWQRLAQERAVAAPADTIPGRPATTPSRPTLTVTELGAITIVSADTSLLAALLAEHGTSTSFVTADAWTLLLGGGSP